MTSVVFALVDTSGSMCGGKIAAIRTQLLELFETLQESQEVNGQGISFALLSFDETTKARLYPPVPVDQNTSDQKVREAVARERLDVTPRKDGFYPTTNYCQLFRRLPDYLAESKAFDRIYLLLFTDGVPTDQQQALKQALSTLQDVECFTSRQCQRYMTLEGNSSPRASSAAAEFVRSRGDIFPGDPAGFDQMIDKLRSSLNQAN